MKVVYLNKPATHHPETGNNALVSQLMAQHDVALRRFIRVRSLLEEEECEDIVQEVYERLLKLDDLGERLSDRMDTVRNYLFQIATNLLIDKSRRNKVRKIGDHIREDEVAILSTLHSPERDFHNHSQLSQIQAALNDVQKNPRTAFLMSRLDGRSYREISDSLGVSVSTVEKYISSVLLAIRERVLEK
ncbi:RNA polymerase sigma factor [Gallaecimonas mangrovi]|uniref:RNA polymerase sigma factor n=1 Tax=Gallaecimonas mangrovi TaxID=2291597 RepID=UPI000E209810|nr:RNA polymerase sigma factor [Gallaecimonas mangrovi]